MGRQIQICSSEVDNNFFEDYLKSSFDCCFFQSFAKEIKELEIRSFSEVQSPYGEQIRIWNKKFPWTPAYGQTKAKDKYYITNSSNAPLIEFITTPTRPNPGNGRIYWAKYFAAGPIEYEIKEFEKFYETITKWVIKNSAGKVKHGGINLYYLSDAWRNHIQATASN